MTEIDLKRLTKIGFDPGLEADYRDLRNIVTHKKRAAKLRHFKTNINNKSKHSKKIHSALKKENVVDSKKNNNTETSFIDLNILNQTFSSYNNMVIDKNIVSNEIGRIFQNSLPQNFRFQQVSEVDVLKAVKSIKTNATGVGDISMFLLGLVLKLPYLL